MHPILFQYGFITIHTYGFLIAVAFYLSIQLAARTAQKEEIDPERIMDLGIYILFGAIVGARMLFVAINYESYIDNPLRIFKIWEGGLVYYGGFIIAVPLAVWYVKKHSLPAMMCADIIAPYISLGQSIGRLGCFAAGCCYGAPSNVPWAVVFTDPNTLAIPNIPLHPAQLYSSALNLTIFFILRWLYKRKTFDGQVFGSYLVLYSVARFIVENFRSDERGSIEIIGTVFSTSQLISMLILLLGLFLLFFAAKRRTAAAAK